MTTNEFMNLFIHPSSHKVEQSVEEFEKVNSDKDIKLVKATTLYSIYRHNVFNDADGRVSMKEFFRICGQYLYYTKYVCDHGTEFYYHIVFNDDNDMYKVTKSVVDKRVHANRPETLKDIIKIIPPMAKERD